MKKFAMTLLRKLGRQKLATTPLTGAASSEAAPAVEVDTFHSTAMATLIEVDAYRQRLAAGDPVLNQALGGIELTLAHQLGREIRRQQS